MGAGYWYGNRHERTQKKGTALKQVNTPVLAAISAPDTTVIIHKVEAELDEMWSFVGSKKEPRWLWQALDPHTGQVLAYVCGRRKDEVFLDLKARLEPFGIDRYFSDGWGAYQRHLDPGPHEIGKRNTQKLERKHLTLRTRTSASCARPSASPSPLRCTIS